MKVRQIVFEGVGGLKKEDLYNKGLRASLKYDGSQYHLHIKNNRAYALTSKRISVKTGLLSDRIDMFSEIKEIIFPFKKETIIVCEITAEHLRKSFVDGKLLKPNGSPYTWGGRSNFVASIMNSSIDTIEERYPECYGGNPLRLVAFSVLRYKGVDVSDLSYSERLQMISNDLPPAGKSGKNVKLNDLIYVYALTDFPAKFILNVDKNAFSEGVIRDDKFIYEGFVVNDPISNISYKIKRVKEADCIVIGYDWESTGKYAEKGWIKSILVGLFNTVPYGISKHTGASGDQINRWMESGCLKEIGKISGFEESLRNDISISPSDYLGRIVECEFMEWTGNRMRHPRISDKGFRVDKYLSRCVLSQVY